MARILSVAMMKGYTKQQERLPLPGGQVRAAWDLLQANRGKPVDMRGVILRHHKKYPAYATVRMQLQDVWGLDIAWTRAHIWTLVGEYIGKDYIDYLAQRIDREVTDEDIAKQRAATIKKLEERIGLMPNYEEHWSE